MKYRPGRPPKPKQINESALVIAYLNHEVSSLKAEVRQLQEKLSQAEEKVRKYDYVRDQCSKLRKEKKDKEKLANNTR